MTASNPAKKWIFKHRKKWKATGDPPDGSPQQSIGPKSLLETQGSIDEEETGQLCFSGKRGEVGISNQGTWIPQLAGCVTLGEWL